MRKVRWTCVLAAAALTLALSGGGCGGGKKLGIPACDQYIDQERACGDKIGGAEGRTLSKQADMMFDVWSKFKADKDAAPSLASTCKETLADAAKSRPQCDWQ